MTVPKIVVLYHGGCHDGFGAAWAAWKKLGARAEYVGVHHKEFPQQKVRGKEVFLLDICYDRSLMKKLLSLAKKVTVIDHHISRKDEIKMAHDYVYDLKHSGSVLSWKYFHQDKKIPRSLCHIEDSDLWRFKIPSTREVGAVLDTELFDFRVWDKVAGVLENPTLRKKYVEKGKNILAYRKRLVERALGTARAVTFCGIRTLAVNSQVLTSEIGDALARKKPPLGIIWSQKGEMVVVSLRSRGGVDVSKLAARFGGGGHKRAAGFSFSISDPFPWKRLKR